MEFDYLNVLTVHHIFSHHQSWIDFLRGMTWPKVLDADSGLELFDGLGLGLPPVCFATRKAWNWNFDQTTATGHYLTAATMQYHTRRFWMVLKSSLPQHPHPLQTGRHGDGSSALNFQAVIGACQNDQQHKVLCHLFPQLRRLCLGRWLRTDSERVCVQKGANAVWSDAEGFEHEQATWRVTDSYCTD